MKKKVAFLVLALAMVVSLAGPVFAAASVQGAAEGYFSGGTKNTTADAVFENLHDGDSSNDPYIIDLRKAEDYEKAHIPGAVNVSVKALFTADELAKLPQDKQIVAVCYTGQTASQATAGLRMLGYDAHNMKFGMAGWTLIPDVVKYSFSADQSAGYEVETAASEASEVNGLAAPLADTVAAAAEAYYSGGTKNIKAADLFENMHDGDTSNDPFVIDLRSADHYALGHIPGAVNVSVKALFGADTLAKLPPDKQVVVYCYTGQTSSQATAALRLLGYDAASMLFGMPTWALVEGAPAPFDASKSMGYPVEGVAAEAEAAPAELPATGAPASQTWLAWLASGLSLLVAGFALRRRLTS